MSINQYFGKLIVKERLRQSVICSFVIVYINIKRR